MNATALEGDLTNLEVTQDVNQALWGALGDSLDSPFSRTDRDLILNALKWQSNIAAVATGATDSRNANLFYTASVDGLGALLKADACLSAVVLLAQGKLTGHHPTTAHWLCLAVRSWQQNFDDSVFANNPELARRFANPGDTTTTEQLEHRLGL